MELSQMQENGISIFNISYSDVEYQKNLNVIDEKKVLKRIWDKDGSLWKLDDILANESLGWLNLPEQAKLVSEISTAFSSGAYNKYEIVCLVGMGGSVLAAKAIIDFVDCDNSKVFVIKDSTLSVSIDRIQKMVKGRKTLFVIASKSGTTLETIMIYEHLKKLVDSDSQNYSDGHLFIAITDPDTSLNKIAYKEKFHQTFLGFVDVGGRYAALSYFGLLPSALMGCDTDSIVKAARNMKNQLESSEVSKQNLAAIIASILGACAVNNIGKLTFITSQSLDAFGSWLEQLIAESIGKENIGIIPVVKEPFLDADSYLGGRTFIYFRYGRNNNETNDIHVKKLIDAKLPVLWIEVDEFALIGAQFFLWEFVMAILGALLKINPFDQPDVEKTKIGVNKILNNVGEELNLDYCSDLNVLQSNLSRIDHRSYVALLAFISEDDDQFKYLESLRKKIGDKYKLTTTLGIGPAYLHSTGQMYKGGLKPAYSIFFVDNGTSNLNQIKDYYKFNQITKAQVYSEIEVFKSLGVKSTCIDIAEDSKFTMIDLLESI